jgi:hypothetical protein
MAKLKLKGKVQHIPGPWGAAVPVAGAAVTIIDIDAPGAHDDTIWTGTTNASGEFSGTSDEWQDTMTTRVWVSTGFSGFPPQPTGYWETKKVPDPTDIMVLKVKVSHGGQSATLPFAFLGDNVLSPVVVPWGPPQPPAVGKVNGQACASHQEVVTKIKAAVDAGVSPITIEVYGADLQPLLVLGQSPAQLKTWVQQRVPGGAALFQPYASGLTGTEIFWILLAVAVIIMAVGASAFLVMCGVAIIYAIHQGYVDLSAEQCASIPAPGGLSSSFCAKIVLSK